MISETWMVGLMAGFTSTAVTTGVVALVLWLIDRNARRKQGLEE